MLNDVEFREVQEVAMVDKVKIVACDGKSKYIVALYLGLNTDYNEQQLIKMIF